MVLLSEPLWSNPLLPIIVSIIAIIVSAAIPIVIYVKQQAIKEISYDIVSDTPIFSIDDDISDNMQILFKGKQLTEAHLIIIRIWNSGTNL